MYNGQTVRYSFQTDSCGAAARVRYRIRGWIRITDVRYRIRGWIRITDVRYRIRGWIRIPDMSVIGYAAGFV